MQKSNAYFIFAVPTRSPSTTPLGVVLAGTRPIGWVNLRYGHFVFKEESVCFWVGIVFLVRVRVFPVEVI